MKAAVVNAPGAGFVVEDVDLADPLPHEIVVEVRASGLCHSDLSIAEQGLGFPMPVLLGHHDGEHALADLSDEIGAVTDARRDAAQRPVEHAIRGAIADGGGDAGEAIDEDHSHRERRFLQHRAGDAIAQLPREAAALEPGPSLRAGFVGRCIRRTRQRWPHGDDDAIGPLGRGARLVFTTVVGERCFHGCAAGNGLPRQSRHRGSGLAARSLAAKQRVP